LKGGENKMKSLIFRQCVRRESLKMRKISLILALSLVLVLAVSAVAMAATNGPHGNFTTNTGACASCHTTHTAASSKLIAFTLGAGTQNDTYKTCTYCHNSGAASSKYDEVNGQIKDGTNLWSTLGGGFQNMATIEGANTYATTAAVTSKHGIDATNGTLVSIPGGNTNVAGKMELKCSSCHDPHGTTNSRQLKTSISRLNTDNVSYTVVDTSGVNITVSNQLLNETATYNNTFSNFCGACHYDYMQSTSGSGSTQSGTYTTGLYRHRVAVNGSTMLASGASGYSATNFSLPTSTTTDVICATCHYSHGTTATVSAGTYASGSTLLRMDERGVCQNCHNKTPDTTRPTVVGASSYQVSATDKTHVVLTFSTYVNQSGAQTATNYTITGPTTPTVTSAVLQANGTLGKQVVLTLSAAPNTSGAYTVTVNAANVKDLNGNLINSPGNTFAFTGK
jgi:predicted CXXCH cytochrome family protein